MPREDEINEGLDELMKAFLRQKKTQEKAKKEAEYL